MRIVTAFYREFGENTSVVLVMQNNNEITTQYMESPPPYFYQEAEHPIPSLSHLKVDYVDVINGRFIKYTLKRPRDVVDYRNDYSREADIPYVKRVIYDSKMNLGDELLTKCYIDTEAYNPMTRFTDFILDEIKSVSIITHDNNRFVIYNLKDSSQKTRTEKIDDNTTYIIVPTEHDLLNLFYEITQNEAMYVGWNLREFDYEFIKARCMIYNIYEFNRHVWMDLMSLYKRFVTSYSKTSIVTSFALENVAHHELGVGKLDKKEALWGNDMYKEMRYNLRDSELTRDIDIKTKLTELIDSISTTLNILVDDCVYFSNAIEYSVIRELHNRYIFKNKTHIPPTQSSKYKGAYVQDAPVGIFENVAVFDFSSLYPNIIRTFNLGPETIDDNGSISVPNLPYHYTDKYMSVYNKMITQLLELRKHYKKLYETTHNEIYNTMQIGVKFLIASFYGVLGFENGRLYDKRIAESITTIGQYLIKMIGEKYGSIYGDTDSVMIPVNSSKFKTTIKETEEDMNIMINDRLKQYNTITNTLDIRFEKLFSKIYFYGKKKRYYGIVILDENYNTCNVVVSRGLEIRRTDWCPLAIEYETNILKLLLNNIKDAKQYHESFIENIRNQPYEKFVIHKSITKPIPEYKSPPPHIRVATRHDYIGSKIGYVITGYDKKGICGVSRDSENATPSYKYYKERQIIPIYERLLKPLIGKQIQLITR